jgi:hypothetical protein
MFGARAEAFQRSMRLRAVRALRRRYQARHRAAMPRDGHFLAALRQIEQMAKRVLGFIGANFGHNGGLSERLI